MKRGNQRKGIKRVAASWMTALAIALIAGSAWAKKEVNPADYPLTAHIVSVSQMRMPMTATVYNQETGERSRVRAITRTQSTTVKIGRVLYTADRVCGGVKAGMDIPARLDEKKNNIWTGGGEQLKLLLGNKVCTLRVVGTEEQQ